MAEIWVSSDPHFNHHNILKFTDHDGKLIRGDKFKDIDEMNEHIVQEHNKLVSPQDHYYCLGDVAFSKDASKISNLLSRMNGKKRLILGNHDDIVNQPWLIQHFEKIMIWRIFKEFEVTLSHIPLHESSIQEKSKWNVHGHIHQNKSPTNKHINVSMEAINYQPQHLETLLKIHKYSID